MAKGIIRFKVLQTFEGGFSLSHQLLITNYQFLITNSMKRIDLYFLLFFVTLIAPFVLIDLVYDFYHSFNQDHGVIMSFLKFAVLATFGEMIGMRIRSGVFSFAGFQLLSRVIIWGLIGITIKLAFGIFAVGTPILLQSLGLENAVVAFKGEMSFARIFVAFSISFAMNVIYAPVMMTFHKITDTHLVETKAGFPLFKRIDFVRILQNLNWDVQWNFVFKKTIPFFWIPAHTITFLMPEEFRVLFAALLGIALGVILAFAAKTK